MEARQHYMKLKRESVAARGQSEGTPRKPQTPKSSKGDPKKKGLDKDGNFAFGDGDDDEEDLMNDTPSKKRKTKIETKEDEELNGIYEAPLFKTEDSKAENACVVDLVNSE